MTEPFRSVTIHAVAAAAGVSIATVSRVLNGHSRVDAEMAARVWQAVQDSGYIPSPAGRALRRQVADAWTVIVPGLNSFYSAILAAVESVATRNGIEVTLSVTREDPILESKKIAAAVAHHVAGVIVSATSECHSNLAPLVDAGVPTVLIDRRATGFEGDHVVLDNELAGRLAAEHLIANGYRRPAILAGPLDVSSTAGRVRGFTQAVADAGLAGVEGGVVRSKLNPESAQAATLLLLGQPDPPDALYACSPTLTLGAFEAAQARIGLIGQDDDPWTRLVHPSVTVIEQPTQEMGTMAAEQLLLRMRDDKQPARTVVTAPRLIARESSHPR